MLPGKKAALLIDLIHASAAYDPRAVLQTITNLFEKPALLLRHVEEHLLIGTMLTERPDMTSGIITWGKKQID